MKTLHSILLNIYLYATSFFITIISISLYCFESECNFQASYLVAWGNGHFTAFQHHILFYEPQVAVEVMIIIYIFLPILNSWILYF